MRITVDDPRGAGTLREAVPVLPHEKATKTESAVFGVWPTLPQAPLASWAVASSPGEQPRAQLLKSNSLGHADEVSVLTSAGKPPEPDYEAAPVLASRRGVGPLLQDPEQGPSTRPRGDHRDGMVRPKFKPATTLPAARKIRDSMHQELHHELQQPSASRRKLSPKAGMRALMRATQKKSKKDVAKVWIACLVC